jgi:hypothetical protein
LRELNNISAIDLEPRKPRGHGSARGSHFAMTAIVPTEGRGRREAVMRTKKGAQWIEGMWLVPPLKAGLPKAG